MEMLQSRSASAPPSFRSHSASAVSPASSWKPYGRTTSRIVCDSQVLRKRIFELLSVLWFVIWMWLIGLASFWAEAIIQVAVLRAQRDGNFDIISHPADEVGFPRRSFDMSGSKTAWGSVISDIYSTVVEINPGVDKINNHPGHQILRQCSCT